MTQEQEKALKIVERLIDRMHEHTFTSEEIMILIQGILSNDCGNSCYKPITIPQYEQPSNPIFRPGEIYCDATEVMNFKNETESLAELKKKLEEQGYADNPIKFDPKPIEKVNGAWTYTNSTKPKFCAGDNIPDMQYEVH